MTLLQLITDSKTHLFCIKHFLKLKVSLKMQTRHCLINMYTLYPEQKCDEAWPNHTFDLE